MNTQTVLTIIEMIEAQIKWTDCKIQSLPLRQLQNHLQEYIEGLVSQAENQLGGGE